MISEFKIMADVTSTLLEIQGYNRQGQKCCLLLFHQIL